MTERWYLAQNGRRIGPYSTDQLRRMAMAGVLRPTDLLLKEGTPKWSPANLLDFLFSHQAEVPVGQNSSRSQPRPERVEAVSPATPTAESRPPKRVKETLGRLPRS